jgi:hypothetical protein
MRPFFTKIHLPNWSIPLALLAICGAAFGLLTPWLGFHQDDWHFVYYAFTGGAAGLKELFYYDGHPLAAWSYILAFQLLGFKPLGWHLLSLLLRWLSVTALWLCFQQVWPARRRETFFASVLYAIFPVFVLQAQAVAYFEVWLSFIFLFASFYFTLRSVRNPQRFWLFTGLALAFKLAHSFTSEYTWGTELLRPLLVWFTLTGLPGRDRLKRTLVLSLPHLLPSALVMGWRVFFFQSPVATRAAPKLVSSLLADPLSTLLSLAQHLLPDTISILFSSWTKTLQPLAFVLSDSSNRLFLLVAGLSGLGLWAFFTRLAPVEDAVPAHDNWNIQALITGLGAFFFGMAPSYAIGAFSYIRNEPWNGRFALGALPGAALIIAALFFTLIQARKPQAVTAAILVGLLVGWHLRAGNDFRWAWEKQRDLYQQLTWRIPALEPNTALVSNQEVLPLMGDYPLGFALGSIYQAPRNAQMEIPLWYFAISSSLGGQVQPLLVGQALTDQQHSTFFNGHSQQSVYFSFQPEDGQCLWVIRPEFAAFRWLPADLAQVSAITALERIRPQPVGPFNLMETIFGVKQTRPWCYYFQKAELARQSANWAEIHQLWQQASQHDLRPAHGLEYLPFIEAAGRLGDWKNAQTLTRSANKITRSMNSALCPVWRTLAKEAPPAPERDTAVAAMNDYLGCAP